MTWFGSSIEPINSPCRTDALHVMPRTRVNLHNNTPINICYIVLSLHISDSKKNPRPALFHFPIFASTTKIVFKIVFHLRRLTAIKDLTRSFFKVIFQIYAVFFLIYYKFIFKISKCLHYSIIKIYFKY